MLNFLLISAIVLCSPCTDIGGVCKPASQCDQSYSNIVFSLCDGDASIRCCVGINCRIPQPTDPKLSFKGKCQEASSCKSTPSPGLCPGSSSIRCCPQETAPSRDIASGTNLTPVGRRLVLQSQDWSKLQLLNPFVKTYPQKAQCAVNLSKVLVGMADLDSRYSSPLVLDMINAIKRQQVPARSSSDYALLLPKQPSATYVKQLEKMYGGYLPIGTVVGGCLYENCEGEAGDGHISFVCKVTNVARDAAGLLTKATYHLCHNNWLRRNVDPARPLGGTLGKVGDYLVDQQKFKAGILERQWMDTPWLEFSWVAGKLTGVRSILPELDDLDPSQGYYVRLAVPVEISNQLQASDRKYQA